MATVNERPLSDIPVVHREVRRRIGERAQRVRRAGNDVLVYDGLYPGPLAMLTVALIPEARDMYEGVWYYMDERDDARLHALGDGVLT